MAESASPENGSRRRSRRKRSRRHNPDGTMTLLEHVYEFRRRITYATLAIVIGGIFGFIWFEQSFGVVPSLGNLIRGPYCSLDKELLADFNKDGPCLLLQTKPFEVFMIRLKVGIAVGAVLFAPVWLYQLWAFIAPGLYSGERKYARVFVAAATVLFAMGAVLAYAVVPLALDMLVGFGGSNFVTALTGSEYISFILTLLIIFGVSFELPLLVVMLNRVGVVKYEQLKRWRRGIIMGLFVFAAFVTPGNDPFSMLALAGALTILFELAIQIARLHDRKLARKRKDLGWDDLDDNEAAPFEYTPSTAESEEVGAKRSGTDDVT